MAPVPARKTSAAADAAPPSAPRKRATAAKAAAAVNAAQGAEGATHAPGGRVTLQAAAAGLAPQAQVPAVLAADPPVATAKPTDGRVRAVIDAVLPAVDGGRFPVKRVCGEPMQVEAHCFTDGHDVLRVMLAWRAEAETAWHEVEMRLKYNDEWHAEFPLESMGRYFYTVTAWVDHFESWRKELQRRVEPADIRIAAQVGAGLLEEAAARAQGEDRERLAGWAEQLRSGGLASDTDPAALKAQALDDTLAEVVRRWPDRHLATTYDRELSVFADRERARFSTWYELFPRSVSAQPGRHGSFREVEAELPRIARMGFDVLYFPPIHPIGREKRKGKNNALVAEPGDVGSPWAIGAAEGGHKSILPELGTPEEFRHLVAHARELGMEVAMDIAYQCAPDHPYVEQHPAWFRWRPDGTVQYAENPPKKYQDIYPFNFESEDWAAMWEELKSVLDHWIGEGVRIFRVDNPHTKSFAFWEWAIAEVKRQHPDVIFLAEAFTRPKVMHRLAKLGFTQSYTYFTWRNTKQELVEYFTELAQESGREYFRPNVWPNTPDILHEALQSGRRSTFMARLVLAATLSANYGIYGPAYELMEHLPREHGSEEYLHSEKYQLRNWDLARPDSLAPFIERVNAIRRDNRALQSDWSLQFFPVDNDQLLAYVKRTPDGANVVLTVVNLDPEHTQSGWVEVDLELLGVESGRPFQVHDLLSGQRFTWNGTRHFVMLDPGRSPAHVFRVRRHLRSEKDFDYFE
ncbi:alpha-1,4-glucan--maltose-1-phosphate maltosyltransferase [Eleftheria terrae]|uniref:alpha-1,4-glucan--maltose-1-phosphate maltosyltransferase n=1 Tax=Eleftheria terrae TaxID=1597781 RepID=UPI00263A56AE|nr:alpha-1,4-glucan--maltose-1-phosphate maltosyltransferase [Eleftheria terrae]WKB52924.1 alpha-1,4-glucan--maltose-1-phosphate maltosyltransferase [Eleftheria terrae]